MYPFCCLYLFQYWVQKTRGQAISQQEAERRGRVYDVQVGCPELKRGATGLTTYSTCAAPFIPFQLVRCHRC